MKSINFLLVPEIAFLVMKGLLDKIYNINKEDSILEAKESVSNALANNYNISYINSSEFKSIFNYDLLVNTCKNNQEAFNYVCELLDYIKCLRCELRC